MQDILTTTILRATISFLRTATEDGKYMAKILSTFSKMEQSRFEAFKRVSFPGNAIRRYVAFCLAERQQHQRQAIQCPKAPQVFAGSTEPQLQDLVVPGQEEEITIVVATLAKAYAQRLCAAAKAQAQVQQQQQSQSTTSSGDAGALQPEHVLQAFYSRTQQGQDPGFFLQANESITMAGNSDTTGKEQMKRTAALAAQEECDRVLEEYKEFCERNPPPAAVAAPETAAAAPVKEYSDDSDSGDEDEMDLEMEVENES
jgi:hTAFII28-like protein conserved region